MEGCCVNRTAELHWLFPLLRWPCWGGWGGRGAHLLRFLRKLQMTGFCQHPGHLHVCACIYMMGSHSNLGPGSP